MKNCAIIGAGIAGLAMSIRLAVKGYKVEVYESNSKAGGKICERKIDGFRFDKGPSVFTLPHLIEELFEISGKSPKDYFNYSKLEKPFTYFFEDGTKIVSYSDKQKFGDEIEAKTIDSRDSLEKYLVDIKAKYELTKNVFIENSLHLPKNYFKKEVLNGILNIRKLDAFKTMDKGNRQFFKDPKLIRIFNNFAVYVGSNPFVAPGTLNMIQHLEINIGTFIPEKGMYSLIEALLKLAKDLGVKFHFNTKVEKILVDAKEVKGVLLDSGEEKRFDIVVSNMDVYQTYHKLLNGIKKPSRFLDQPKSSSAIGFYWGINREFKEMGVHNMIFGKDKKKEFDSIFDEKSICDDPSLYLYISSKKIKEDAPEGCENWFLLINAPHNQGQNWDDLIKQTRINVIKKINRMFNVDLESHIIVSDEIVSPLTIEEQYGCAKGAIYGNSSNSKFATFLRHPNFNKSVKGLYFVGGSVHPGAGIPMCISSAKIVDKMLG